MLGRSVNAGYRRDLNLLSQRDYTLSRGRYIAIYIRAIVGSAIVAMVLAGGEGTLSNLVNSRISTIFVLAQYKPESLIKHVAPAWSPWFADGQGAINVLLPRSPPRGRTR